MFGFPWWFKRGGKDGIDEMGGGVQVNPFHNESCCEGLKLCGKMGKANASFVF